MLLASLPREDEPVTDTSSPHTGRLGLAQASALYIAAVLGTGILVLPALSARAAGPGSVIAVIAVLVLSVPLAGTFAALASRFPDSGGVATYVRMSLGDTAARISGYLFLFGVIIGVPAVGILAGRYLAAIFGGGSVAVVAIAVLVLVLPFVSNYWGFAVSGRVQLALTGALVVIIVLVVALAAPSADAANFEPLLPHGWLGVGVAISLLVWAFSGWEAVTHIAAEFRNPRRTIPLATAIAVVAVGIGYLALQLVTVAALGPKAGTTGIPLLTLVRLGGSTIGPGVVAAIALVVSLGVLNTYVGAFAKLGSALGRDGDLPRWFARGAEAGGIPRRALALTGLVSGIYFVAAAVTGFDLTPFILINTACMVSVYALGMIAALRLLPTYSLGWWFAVVSIVLIAGLLVLAGIALVVPAALALVALIVKWGKNRALVPRPL
jgi:amino acid efflux transporter